MKERIQDSIDLDTSFGYLEDVPVTYELVTDSYPGETHPDDPCTRMEYSCEVTNVMLLDLQPHQLEAFGIDLAHVAQLLEARHGP